MNEKETIILVVLIISFIGFFLLAYNIIFTSTNKGSNTENKSYIKYSNVTHELKPISLNDLQELVLAAEKSGKIIKCDFVTKRYNILGGNLGVCKGFAYIINQNYFIIKFDKISNNNPYLAKLSKFGLDKIYGIIDGDVLYLYFKMNNGTYYMWNTAITEKLNDFKWNNVLAYCEETNEKVKIPEIVKNKEETKPIEDIIFS